MPPSISRRAFIHLGGMGLLSATNLSRAADDPSAIAKAPRPKPPYRIWFQPRLLERDPDLYANMTIDASGWLDPRVAQAFGKTALGWAYGINNPDATGPEYWRNACSVAARTYPRAGASSQLISAGIALDEWTTPRLPLNKKWMLEGLREGRRENPDIFIALWATDPTPGLFELGRQGLVDLFIIEGYTHSVERGLSMTWEGALRRCELFAAGGVMDRTVFSFGHITAQKSFRGEHLKGAWLRARAEELRRRYPQMPGVAFYQHPCPDTYEQRELVRACDRLSAELWPDAA